MKLILQIALGVSLGIVSGGSLLYLYTGAFAEHTISTALKQPVAQNALVTPGSGAVNSLVAGNTPVIIPPHIPPEPVEPAAVPPTSTTPAPIAEINIAGKDSAVTAADKEEQKQKDIAFKAYYKKPAECWSHHEDHDTLVACGNDYIRAKAKFEELWQQGEFKK